MADIRIMVVGKTGAGKSASGNTILGEKVFVENMSSESVTKTCLKHQQKVEGGKISVIDTPGLFDTKISQKIMKDELEKCVSMSVPGPHAFLLVVRLDVRFTDEEKKTVKWIQENFGEKAADYSLILFTRGDQIDEPIEEYLTKNRQIEELVRQCKNRYHVFNNKDKNPSQVNKLLDKIVRMVMENGGGHYTNEMYKEAQKRQREENERRKLEEEEKMKNEFQKRQREEDERRKLEEEQKINKKVQERLREEDERRKLEEEEKINKEVQKRLREEFERRKLEEEEKINKEVQERLREEDERRKLEEEEKINKEAQEMNEDKQSFFSTVVDFFLNFFKNIVSFII